MTRQLGTTWSQPDWLRRGMIVTTDDFDLHAPVRVLASYPADSESGILVDVQDAAGQQVRGIDSHWLAEA